MDERAILHCQIGNWYHSFEQVTYRTRLIELPDAFVKYLLQDGVYLPEYSAALPVRSKPDKYDDYQDWNDEETEPEDAEEASKLPAFPELYAQIQEAIAELGGRVLPKLNWSAPLDAAWLTTCGSVACSNAEEVMLLLKSSDRVAHDLCHAFDACSSRSSPAPRACLALRMFYDLRPGREFRCFMHNHELIAVSQRNIAEHFPHLAAERAELLEALLEFAEQHLERFPEPDFAADVYVAASGRVRLVDFNPIGGTTSSLLFDWAELPYALAAAGAPAGSSSMADSNAAASEAAPTGGWRGEGPSAQRPPENGHTTCRPADVAGEADAAGGAGPSGGGDPAQGRALAGGSAESAPKVTESHCPSALSRLHEPESRSAAGGTLPALPGPSGGPAGDGRVSGDLLGGEVEFRVVEEPEGIRPNPAACRAPFDFADTGPGGAVDELLRKLRVETR